MDQKRREETIIAVEKAFQVVGAENYEQGIETALQLLSAMHDRVAAIHTRDNLRKALDSIQMTRREEWLLLFTAKHAPQLLRRGLKTIVMRLIKELPRESGGRPTALSKRESQDALDYLLRLLRKGCTLEQAKTRTAINFHCSRRTIERLWQDRSSLDEDGDSAITMEEAVTYLSTD